MRFCALSFVTSRSTIRQMEFQNFVQKYKRLRGVSIKVTGDLINALIREDFGTAARQLGMLHGKYIDLETDDESAVLMDHAIYDIYHDGMNAVDRLLLTEPYAEGSDEHCLLQSMQTAHFALIQVEEPIPGVGIMAVARPRNIPIFLIDMNLSMTVEPGTISMVSARLSLPIMFPLLRAAIADRPVTEMM